MKSSWRGNTGTGNGVKVAVLDSRWAPEPYIFPASVKRFIHHAESVPSHAAKVAQVIGSSNPAAMGVAPACEIYIAEVIGDLVRGWGGLAEALLWAEEQGCQVINMSFACPTSDQVSEKIMQRLDEKGVILTASFNAYMHWPHELPWVIAVGMPHQHGQMDIQVDGEAGVLESGVAVPFRGTSVACARLSGIAACMKETNPSITRQQLLRQLRCQMAPGGARTQATLAA